MTMHHSTGERLTSVCILKTIMLSTILIGFLLYIIDISIIHIPPNIINFRLTGSEVWNWDELRSQQEQNWDKSYFVNTIGCRMPSFLVMNDAVHKHMFPVSDVKCKMALTKSNSNYLWIGLNRTEIRIFYGVDDVNQLECAYQPFERKTDERNKFDKNKFYHFRFGDIMKIDEEFIRVMCTYGNVGEIYSDYHYFVPRNKERMTSLRPDTSSSSDLPNILILGIDSMSRMNFHRQMNKTVDIVLNQLKAIEFFGYNKVEDNTYPNLVPALTGLDQDELAAACLPHKNSTYDFCQFIWNMYKRKGYATLFAEDMASLGLFNYLRPGFQQQFTDYNIRPALVEMERHIASQRKGNAHLCLGSRRPVDIILDYATKFIYSIGTSPYFSFFWTTSYTHDFFNFPQLIDGNFAGFLKNLSNGNALNNTFLILMSDHGIRWGSFRNTYQGMMEERQPFLYLIPPKWFPQKYPTAFKNLLLNRRKLSTHFDLYETLRDLLAPDTILSDQIQERSKELLELEPMPRGISLFLPISPSRTCLLAGISPHWCTCHERKDISTTDSKVLRAARKIVESINKMVKSYPQCQQLSLNSIANANVGISNMQIVGGGSNTTANHFMDVTVRLQTKPGFAEFEATVRIHADDQLELTGTISRTNLYGKQSQCVDDYKIKLYCFCDSFL